MLTTRTVTTTGHGAVALPRDSAVLTVAAVHRAATLPEALAGAESARAEVVVVARRHIGAGAVATQGLSTWPTTDDLGRPDGFEARHSLSVRCTGLELAGTLLQALADEIGDRLSVDGVTLAATPAAVHLATAREAAYADAHTHAEHLALLAGAALGQVLSLSEGAPGPLAWGVETARSSVGLEGGTEEVAATVTVTWELG